MTSVIADLLPLIDRADSWSSLRALWSFTETADSCFYRIETRYTSLTMSTSLGYARKSSFDVPATVQYEYCTRTACRDTSATFSPPASTAYNTRSFHVASFACLQDGFSCPLCRISSRSYALTYLPSNPSFSVRFSHSCSAYAHRASRE